MKPTDQNKFLIIINWDNCIFECFGPYDTAEKAEKALKRIKSGWDFRDWYGADADIVKLKPAI